MQSGEKMSPKEVDEIFSLADINEDGKLDYAEPAVQFCRFLESTAEQCQTAALKKLEADAKLKRQNFGNQLDNSPQSSESQPELPASETQPRTELETTQRKVFLSCVIDKQRFLWRGELSASSYLLLPFTTGCRLMKRTRKTSTKTAQLVKRTQSEELELTKEFKTALSDIFEVIDLDGSGLLSLEEYNFFEQRTSGEKCDEDAWDICKENFDTKKN
ncbi:hypothetical protein cypCar_00036720 [Cyprinus carpio]|nr:hypothetical protein cypCar_00036720 [Cyprinus carpio]